MNLQHIITLWSQWNWEKEELVVIVESETEHKTMDTKILSSNCMVIYLKWDKHHFPVGSVATIAIAASAAAAAAIGTVIAYC